MNPVSAAWNKTMSHGPSMEWWESAVAEVERQAERTVPTPKVSEPKKFDTGTLLIQALAAVVAKRRKPRAPTQEPADSHT